MTMEQRQEPMAGRTVLVTGGSSGLGAAVVDAVAQAGGRPVNLDLGFKLFPKSADEQTANFYFSIGVL